MITTVLPINGFTNYYNFILIKLPLLLLLLLVSYQHRWFVQVLATLYVSYKILKTAEENYQELSQDREEHQQVNWDDPGMAILRLCKDQDKRYAYVYIKSCCLQPRFEASEKGT